MYSTRVVHLDRTRGLTASRAPELHCHLAFTCREIAAQNNFQEQSLQIIKVNNEKKTFSSRDLLKLVKNLFSENAELL